jgi:hypothetical protein
MEKDLPKIQKYVKNRLSSGFGVIVSFRHVRGAADFLAFLPCACLLASEVSWSGIRFSSYSQEQHFLIMSIILFYEAFSSCNNHWLS